MLKESDFDKTALIQLATESMTIQELIKQVSELLNGEQKIDVLVTMQSTVTNVLDDMIKTAEKVGGKTQAKQWREYSVKLNAGFLLMKGMSLTQVPEENQDDQIR